MDMTFYWGKEVTLLFDSWKTESWPSYSFTLLFCFLLSLFYQRLEAQLFKLKSVKIPTAPLQQPPLSLPLLSASSANNNPSTSPKSVPDRRMRIASAALFGFTSAIGYVIMLAVMSYNGGVFLAVVFGTSIGYFLFRSKNPLED